MGRVSHISCFPLSHILCRIKKCFLRPQTLKANAKYNENYVNVIILAKIFIE